MVIDSRIGGLGDVWMRLIALHTLSGITNEQHTLIIKPSLTSLASAIFGDRVSIQVDGEPDVVYTHYGLRHLLVGMSKGTKYVHPFHWVLRETRKHAGPKDLINDLAVGLVAASGRLLIPIRKYVWEYQGFMELSALKPFSRVDVGLFENASRSDWALLSAKLRSLVSHSDRAGTDIVVFPSGTAHQIMPVSFARDHLSSASFAFHANDSYGAQYESGGLKVKTFSTPEEMLQLGCDARFVLCTDSFPSHLWQTWGARVLVLLSQQTAKQVVHPGFPESQIINSLAPCVKCRSRVRTHAEHTCDAGRIFCDTWSHPIYVQKLLSLIASNPAPSGS